MASSGEQVFLIGPGYIGREVVDRLLENGYAVTTLVRRQEAAQELGKVGVKTVMGTIDDANIITEQTTKSDIVIHTATADHIESVEAVIAGIYQRASKNLHTIYIHTSGCSFLSDDSNGEYKSDMIYSDKKPEDMDARPDSASHRLIDLAIIKARQRLGAQAKIFIMLPPLIYGATEHGRLSIQVITMARFAVKHKYAGYAGKGKSVWGLIHVKDLSYGYLTMLQWLEKSSSDVALQHPYVFCESGEEISVRTYIYDLTILVDLRLVGRDRRLHRQRPTRCWQDPGPDSAGDSSRPVRRPVWYVQFSRCRPECA
jgi:nucleoside-diphosphate-sugar epimerase